MKKYNLAVRILTRRPLTLSYMSNQTYPPNALINFQDVSKTTVSFFEKDEKKRYLEIVKKDLIVETPAVHVPAVVQGPVEIVDTVLKILEVTENQDPTPVQHVDTFEADFAQMLSQLTVADIKKKVLAGTFDTDVVKKAESNGRRRPTLLQWLEQL